MDEYAPVLAVFATTSAIRLIVVRRSSFPQAPRFLLLSVVGVVDERFAQPSKRNVAENRFAKQKQTLRCSAHQSVIVRWRGK